MNRIGIVLALAVASFGSAACAASQDGDDEGSAQSDDKLQIGPQQQQSLTCHRFPTDSCVTAGAICERHGGQLVCTLDGYCTCQYGATRLAF